MVEKKRALVWDIEAKEHLQKIYEHIKKDSISSARKVKSEILSTVKKLKKNPEMFPPDRFKIDNAGNYRSFEKYSYRVTYKHTGKEIRIIRIRHTKQEPLEY